MKRTRSVAVLCVLAVAALVLGSGSASGPVPVVESFTSPATEGLVTTWAASDDKVDRSLTDVTVRNIVHTSIGGTGLRVRLSNAKGDRPLRLDSVYVGEQAAGAALVPGSNRQVTFDGGTNAMIPPGGTLLSDPIPVTIAPQQRFAVSLHVAGESGALTAHKGSMQISYQSTSGDHAADEGAGAFRTETTAWVWLDALVLDSTPASGTVATLGDSITAGAGTTMSADRRWPDVLADRLAELPMALQMGVANEGISGNRVLGGPFRRHGAGDPAVVRLTGDVLTKPGIETVVLFEGVNDIRAGASAEDILTGYRRLVAQTDVAGVCLVAATILPFGGAAGVDPGDEMVRLQVNDFIRHSGAFEAVLDFDAAVRDPAAPDQLRPEFFGDGLHPNDAGHAAIAHSIDLDDLRCG